MKKLHHTVRLGVLGLVDLIYPPFRRFLPLQTFRYAACGGGNTALNIFLYFVVYNFVLLRQVVHLGPVAISAHIAAFLIAFCITFPIGFYLSMYVVFQGSYLRRRVQLMRYFLVAIICILLNYVLLKLFVDYFGWYPTPSLMLTTVLVIGFSYLSQQHFSFRAPKKKVQPQARKEALRA